MSSDGYELRITGMVKNRVGTVENSYGGVR